MVRHQMVLLLDLFVVFVFRRIVWEFVTTVFRNRLVLLSLLVHCDEKMVLGYSPLKAWVWVRRKVLVELDRFLLPASSLTRSLAWRVEMLPRYRLFFGSRTILHRCLLLRVMHDCSRQTTQSMVRQVHLFELVFPLLRSLPLQSILEGFV